MVISCHNVGIRYAGGEEILSNMTFELKDGSFHYFVGPSGSGKSSLMNMFHLSVQASRGDFFLFQERASQIPTCDYPIFRRKIGVVFQQHCLLPHLTIFQNIALPLYLQHASPSLIRSHVQELIRWVGITGRENAYPHLLSGGEQQRVAIARAVIGCPDLLIADEPTGSVDSEIALKLMYLFEELNKQGTTIIIATHDTNIVNKFAHPTYYISNRHVKLLS